MLDIITENFTNSTKKLDIILKPIEKELSVLEEKLTHGLTSTDQDLDRMIAYFFRSGGKRLRPAIVILFAKAINKGYLPSVNFELAQAVEMIHTASLIHDDVIDNAETRRGILTLNKQWGAKRAVIAGDFILSRALSKLTKINMLAVKMFSDTLNELCVGEILQKNQDFQLISLEDYINKSERKTAKLFTAATECAAATSPGINNLIIDAARGYSLNFGIAFQIIDDILDFTGNRQQVGKPIAGDLKNGVITAPVIFANQQLEQNGDSTLKTLIETKFKNEKEFKRALSIVIQSEGIEKANKLAQEYVEKAMGHLNVIEDSSYKQALIDLAYFTLQRTS